MIKALLLMLSFLIATAMIIAGPIIPVMVFSYSHGIDASLPLAWTVAQIIWLLVYSTWICWILRNSRPLPYEL
jgi:hypothetical protein